MKQICSWHKKFTEKKRTLYRLSHYQVYLISWVKGIITGLIILYFV